MLLRVLGRALVGWVMLISSSLIEMKVGLIPCGAGTIALLFGFLLLPEFDKGISMFDGLRR